VAQSMEDGLLQHFRTRDLRHLDPIQRCAEVANEMLQRCGIPFELAERRLTPDEQRVELQGIWQRARENASLEHVKVAITASAFGVLDAVSGLGLQDDRWKVVARRQLHTLQLPNNAETNALWTRISQLPEHSIAALEHFLMDGAEPAVRTRVVHPASRDDFAIAIICALPEERDTVEALMTRDYISEGQRYGRLRNDDNSYTVGELGGKPVVLVAPRAMGTTNTRDLARGLHMSYPNILYAFVVGIAGGAPFLFDGTKWKASEIQLGDVIVSTHVIEYDFGREHENGFRRRTDLESVLPRAPAEVTNFVNLFVRGRSQAFQRILQKTNTDLANCKGFETGKVEFHEHPGSDMDNVYDLGYRHKHQEPTDCLTCSQCTMWYHEVCEEASRASCQELGCKPRHSNPIRGTKIHFGRFASGNAVMKSGHRRDMLVQEDRVIGFEMEGAGAWEVFGTIVVKGVVDYADSHKSKEWRGYSAARAALCAAAMIEEIELPDKPS
jgi:nucleoside phosphorylase